jgi:TRAP-type C4-dicarboxylate transport system permease large subunit
MDLALLVYGISLITSIGSFLAALIVVSLIITFCSAVYFAVSQTDINYSWNRNRDGTLIESIVNTRKTMKKAFKIALITLGISSFVAILIPSEKTAYIMVGAYATQKVAENEKVQETGQKVLSIINNKLDSYVEEGIKKATEAATKEKK